MSNHLQELCDQAVRDELAPLGEQLDGMLGGLDFEQAVMVGEALRSAFMAGVRVGIVNSVADVIEQGVDVQLDLRVA